MQIVPRNTRLYNQALEIMQLSRSISGYLVFELAELNENGKEPETIYFTGDIVKQSNALAPEIIAAENERFQEDRMQHVLSLEYLTRKLLKTCKRLEHAESNGRDFLKLLRKELKKFRKLQQQWVLTL